MDITAVVSDVLDNFLQMAQDYQNQLLMEELREEFNS